MAYALEMKHITKRFPGVLANEDVNLTVGENEIHGLIGENGAGKSTLMNILYGLLPPDEGGITLFSKEVSIPSPNAAIELGVGMVHQHFMLMPNLSVLQNIILGNAPKKGLFIDEGNARQKICEIMEKYSLPIDLDAKIYQLSVGEKQRVEIIKALYRGAKLLILDEPTAVLTPQETDALMDVLRRLRDQGCSIIFITHKLREVLAITDRVTVMRKGVVTGSMATKDATAKSLSTLIVGREVELKIPRKPYQPGEVTLSCKDLFALNRRGLPALKGLSFDVRAGEIVGIAGVEGNGQSELIETITGLFPLESGQIFFCGKPIEKESVRRRRELGMAHIPEDRLKVGLAKSCTIRDNLILNRYYQAPYSRAGVLHNNRLHEFSERLCHEFGVKTPDSDYALGTLSGGNMQKVVLAREIESLEKLLIAAQPTRGVDIGAIEYIHTQLIRLRDEGKAILLVSAELDEILSLSDRILVMYEGQIVAEFASGETDEKRIGLYMTGAGSSEGGAAK